MAKGENQRSVERAVERMRGEPGHEPAKAVFYAQCGQCGHSMGIHYVGCEFPGCPCQKTGRRARQRLLGAGGAPIDAGDSQDDGGTASNPGKASEDYAPQKARRNAAVCVGEKPWSYGAGRCLKCGGRPFNSGDMMRCDECGWEWRFNRSTGRWEPMR